MVTGTATQGEPTKFSTSITPSDPALLRPLATPPSLETRSIAEQTPQDDSVHQQSSENLPEASPVRRQRFPDNLLYALNLTLGQDGKAYSIQKDAANPYVLLVGSRQLNNIIREFGQEENLNLRKSDISDINAMLQAQAERGGVCNEIWHRVAPVSGGIEIDLGDESHTRIRITARKVETVTSGSSCLFSRSPVSQSMAMPAEAGDLKRLAKYLNLHPIPAILLTAWITYVLAHPKLSTSKYPILVLSGGQGCGKSSLCNNILLKLIDPSRVGLQILPNNSKDLAIAAQNGHVLYFDNIRGFSQSLADVLCVAATGGVISSRQLYTDADQQVLNLHVALVLNGIHSFINQPDLAQRCLPIYLKSIPEDKRRSDTALAQEFQLDLPFIMRGLFDLIAEIFTHLPEAHPTNPERMIDFVRWLAAMEMAQGAPAGVYQTEYSEALRHGQLDSLQENELAAAILELADDLSERGWSGTPEELLAALTANATKGTLRSRDWPVNAISLSKRLQVLEAGLRSQGVVITFTRGKRRRITITTDKVQCQSGGNDNE